MRAALICLVALPALAGESTYVFQSQEDAATPADASVCAAAPFVSNVRLGASLWSLETKHRDGRVKELKHRIGRATACLQLTNFMFPQGLVQSIYVQFDLPQGRYTALGTCTVSSNATPLAFIILAGCTLQLSSVPLGSLGGMATSSSVFNVLHRPGFNTGSTWVLHEYLFDE